MGGTLENGIYLPDQGERNCYNGLKNNWDTLDNLIETVQALSSTGLIRKPVDALPTEDIETNVIYMLKATKPNGDVYRIEYMYIDDHWDALGTSETTLDDYYTKTETNDLPAVKSGINATKVSNYDTHIADTDIHVTLANKQTWDGKQNALDTAQTAAVNSGVNATKVSGYDTHVADTAIHVTASDKTAWNGKQDGLSQTQLNAVNSGVTSAKVTGYDTHVADTSAHVSSSDRTAWNGKQDALTQTQLNNIAAVPDKANSADLATVATTGDYGDLLNAPTIPTVNNATLTIQKNGTDVATFTANASSNVTANLAIPTDTSDLTNGAGFLTQHNPIDNELSASSENAVQNKVINTALNGKAPLVHAHAAGDVTSGTFNIARIPNLDASKITSGTIDIARLPKGALERLVKVANQAARYALTTDDVQLGDTVQQLDTGVMYVVTDETKLDSADGYTEFTAGSATSVPWSGVTGKPSTFTPSSHTHGNITNDGKVGTTANIPLITGTGGAVQAGSFGNSANTFCEGNDSRLSDARTPVSHTHGDITNDGKLGTASRALITDGNKNIAVSSVSSTELGYLSGVTSSVQTQLNAKAGLSDNNTFSGDNTFSKTISSSHSIVLSSRYANVQLGAIPSTDQALLRFQCNDKDDDSLCYFRQFYQSSGTSTFQLFVRNKFANGTLSTSGTYDYAYLGIGIESDKSPFAFLKGTFKPYTTGIYDLGSSSYQWNNLYAKNYFYNGTAWGLDKNNTWTGNNQFNTTVKFSGQTGINWARGGTTGTLPSSDLYYGFQNATDSNDNVFDRIRSYVSTTGINLREHIKYAWNDLTKYVVINYWINADGSDSEYKLSVKRVIPGVSNTTDLGTSSYKWKTLNGINPGALSIPDGADSGANSSFTPDTTNWPKDGTAFQATMPIVGWLRITIKNVAGNYAFVRRGTAGANLPWQIFADPTFATDFAEVTLNVPVTDVTYTIRINSSGGFTAKVYPCLGNV